ncbi:MAG: anti-sigma factor [Rhodobiaceae bacterium]|nr:anti-sigma factor [Rhodobiaceae bacterium]
MSIDTDRDDRDDLLAAEYALGTLPHGERTIFQARLEREPELRVLVRDWEERLAPLSEEIESVEPPAGALRGIETRLFGAKGPAHWWSSLFLWRGLAVASLAVAIVLGGVLIGDLRRQTTLAPPLVTVLSGETGAVRMAALFDPDTSTLKVNRTLGTPASGRAFELWLIKGENPPVSLGVLPQNQMASLTVSPALAARMDGAVLAISDEPEGGSPTGLPTGAVLATGKVSAI